MNTKNNQSTQPETPVINHTKLLNTEEMVEEKVLREWPIARVIGKSDPSEQRIRNAYLNQYTIEKQKIEDILAKESQRQARLLNECAVDNLDQCVDTAKRENESIIDHQIDTLPEVDNVEKNNQSVANRFKKARLNFALTFLIFIAAVANNVQMFSSSTFNGINDSLLILTLTLIIMGVVFIVGRFAHPLIHGQRYERVMVVLIGVAVAFTLFLFYLTLAHLLLEASLTVNVVLLKTISTLPSSLVLVTDWFMAGIILGLIAYALGAWQDSIELMGRRVRNKAIKKRMEVIKKVQTIHTDKPARWFTQWNHKLDEMQNSIRIKERALESIKGSIERLMTDYKNTICEYRVVLGTWTGTELGGDMSIAPLFETAPTFKIIENEIEGDKNALLRLQNDTDDIRNNVRITKQAIFDCFEREIKSLKDQAFVSESKRQADKNENDVATSGGKSSGRDCLNPGRSCLPSASH